MRHRFLFLSLFYFLVHSKYNTNELYGNKRKGSRAKTCSRSSLRHHRPTSGAQLSFLIYSTVPKRRPLLYGADAVLIYTQAHTARLPGQVQQRATAHTNNSDAKCVRIVTVCVDMQLSCRPCCCCCYSTCAIIKKTMHTIDWGRLVPPVFPLPPIFIHV